MTDEKICPFMSRCEIQPDGDHLLATTYCQKERCMAWGSKILYTETNTGAVVTGVGYRLIP